MRIRTMTAVLLQVASLAACDGATRADRSPLTRSHAAAGRADEAKQSADAIAVGAVGERERPASSPAPAPEELWFRPTTADPMDRLILRTGQASIEVDSLETAMARLRQLARRAGGFVADGYVHSDSIDSLKDGLDALFAHGRPFSQLLKTSAGGYVEADGRATGGRCARCAARTRACTESAACRAAS